MSLSHISQINCELVTLLQQKKHEFSRCQYELTSLMPKKYVKYISAVYFIENANALIIKSNNFRMCKNIKSHAYSLLYDEKLDIMQSKLNIEINTIKVIAN